MHHIFVSYSRTDAVWVRDLVARLERAGHDVWLDQADIPVTVPWMREVQDAIEESALFLRCESPAFRQSGSCSAEVGLAVQALKPQFVVTVGDDASVCATSVDRTAHEISPARAQRTELRVLARDWDRADRPRNRLVSGRQARRLFHTLAMPPPPSEIERSFLRASRSRARRRITIAACTTALATGSLGATAVFFAAQNRINSINGQEAARYTIEVQSLGLVDQDPYSGLAIAAQDGRDEAAVHAEVISAALAEPTPDDAFTAPHVRRFVVSPVGMDVIVTGYRGHEWHRSATASGVRTATILKPPVPVSTQPPPGGLTAQPRADSGLVVVRKHGRLWRKIYFGGLVQGLAFSPDGRFLAAAAGWQVSIADLSTGQIRQRMRGATGELLDIAWSTDARHIWALDDRRVFSWPTGNAYTLIDNPRANYNSVLPATNQRAVWIAGTHALTEINVATSASLASRTVRDTIGSAGAAPNGTVALLSGKRYLWVVPLSGAGPPRRVQVKNCALGRPTFANNSTAYVPCIGGALMTVSMPSGKITATLPISPAGAYGVRAVPGLPVVYVGDRDGYLYAVEGSRVTRLYPGECDAELSRIAVAPGGTAILPVGSGSGMGLCTHIGLHSSGNPADPGNWAWNAVLEEEQSSIYATSVAFSSHGGSFAIGYSDGTITMHPTRNITPTLTVSTAAGMIRDMLTLSDGNLIVATDAGMVQRIPLCDSCLSDAALARIAAAHLRRAIQLGLAVRKPISSPSHAQQRQSLVQR